MNEYIEFMKKYKANSSDVTLLTQYATMLKKYTDAIKAFEDVGNEEMNNAEASYYIDVQARINKKLFEVAQ